MSFIESLSEGGAFYCKINDTKAALKVQIIRPDGEYRRLAQIDEDWAAEGTEASSVVGNDGVRIAHIQQKWINIHFADGQPGGPFLFDGASVQVGNSKPLKLPASERQIREVFGPPNKVTYRKPRTAA